MAFNENLEGEWIDSQHLELRIFRTYTTPFMNEALLSPSP